HGGSGPPKDPALVQLRYQEAEGAEIQAGVQGDHHPDRDAEHPCHCRNAGEQEGRSHQPDRAADYPRHASSLVVLVDVVTLEEAVGEAAVVGETTSDTRLPSGGAMLRIWLNTDGATSKRSLMVPRARGAIG